MATEIKPIFRFEEEGHRYFLGDRELPSVTTVIGAILDPNVALYTEASRLRGIAVHLACELDDLGTLDESTVGEEWPYLDAYRKFRSEHECQWLGIEERRYEPVYGFAGTLDRRGIVDAYDTILDIKTGAKQPTHGIQLAAYAMLARNSIVGVAMAYERTILRLNDDATYALFKSPRNTLRADTNTFLNALGVYNWKRRNYGG